jgi:hypothetical protein
LGAAETEEASQAGEDIAVLNVCEVNVPDEMEEKPPTNVSKAIRRFEVP